MCFQAISFFFFLSPQTAIFCELSSDIQTGHRANKIFSTKYPIFQIALWPTAKCFYGPPIGHGPQFEKTDLNTFKTINKTHGLFCNIVLRCIQTLYFVHNYSKRATNSKLRYQRSFSKSADSQSINKRRYTANYCEI